MWDSSRATRLITDAAELDVGSILEQPDDQGAFESRKLTIQERSYPPHRLELLAVVQTSARISWTSNSSSTRTTPASSG